LHYKKSDFWEIEIFENQMANPAGSSKEGCGSRRAVLPMAMMIIVKT
jgi:hypothetical protein